MALARWQATIVDSAGNIVPNASIEVRREIAGAPLASLKSDRAGADILGNPFQAGLDGFAAFHVAGGAYRIHAYAAGFDRIWRYVPIGTNAEEDRGTLFLPRGAWSAVTTYAIGDMVSHISGGQPYSFVSNVAGNLNNAPPFSAGVGTSNANWTVLGLIEAPGAPGEPGSSDVVGTSTSSVAIGTGSKTFTIVESNRGWAVGARLRATSAANPATHWVEGVVTSYIGNSLQVTVDLVAGSGSRADWKVHLAGERGQQGLQGIQGNQGIQGLQGIQGVQGNPGSAGADGTDPGILLTWDDVNTDADPGAGNIRANNDTLSSATVLYASKTNRAGDNIAAFLLALDNSTNISRKGGLTLTRSTGNDQATFNVTGVTDATGYVKVAVSGHSGATGFVDGNAISFQFSRDGDKGTDGAGAGDMLKSVYDPTNKNSDAFAMDNMVEGTNTKIMTGAERTKLGHITVTQAVDLDAIESRVIALDAAVVLSGTWNAGSGSFPGGGTAQAGQSYIVSSAGTVNSVAFAVNDRIIAITDNASTSTFVGNWFKADYTDQVLSVNGLTGAVTVAADPGSDGLVARTGSGTAAARSVAVTSSTGLSVTNGDGVSGNPTLAGVNFTGDFGSGGVRGMVPAPAAGDAAAGKVLGAGGGWVAGGGGLSAAYLQGHIDGLILSNNATDATNDIDIGAGVTVSDDGTPMQLASGITKRLDAAWAVGTNQGGRDTGSEANSTWYHVWLIARPDTGVVDALISTSATSPTMPSNYTKKRRIGAVYNDSSGNLRAFTQVGDDFLLNEAIIDVDASNPGTSAVTRTLSVPTGVKVFAKLVGGFFNASGSFNAIRLSSLDTADQVPQVPNTAALNGFSTHSITVAGTTAAAWNLAPHLVRTDTSAQIRSRLHASAAGIRIGIIIEGWTDPRGRRW